MKIILSTNIDIKMTLQNIIDFFYKKALPKLAGIEIYYSRTINSRIG